MKTNSSRIRGLSYVTMQNRAAQLICLGCFQQSLRGPRDLSLRAGVPVEKAALVYPEGSVEGQMPAPSKERIELNGDEWDNLLSAAGVSLEQWIQKSREDSPKQVDPEDLVTNLAVEFGASSDGGIPSGDIQKRIRITLGYASAFYLKASGVEQPSFA